MTGTDTDVGKTRAVAALARALRLAGAAPTIVKLVQTGLSPGEAGDAQTAAVLAGCPATEFARFAAALDPWSAALAAGRAPLGVDMLAAALDTMASPLVAETAGGLAVPLGPGTDFAALAQRVGFRIVLVVGLRLGCINHALLTVAYCEQHALRLAGAVLVERWGPTTAAYRADVERALTGRVPLLGVVPFDPDPESSVASAARLFAPVAAKARA